MKVLWFTNTTSLYVNEKGTHNGGGWISSLEKEFSNKNIDLGICFYYNDVEFKIKKNNVTYYPLSTYNKWYKKLLHNINYAASDKIEVLSYLKIIEDFKPDIIHIFGSEKSYGLISTYTEIPVIIHIQGLLIPYMNAWFPPGINILDYFIHEKYHEVFKKILNYKFFKYNANRELRIIQNCMHFSGRTNWDKGIVKLLAPDSTYYYCSEILRDIFYTIEPWQYNKGDTLKIVTTISKVDYKGFDLVLKTAALIKKYTNIRIEWNVFGIDTYEFIERKVGIKACAVNVILRGKESAESIAVCMKESHVFVHTSYIDNSPNSVCEAQIIGIPVISTNVGGISSLIDDNVTGLLSPTNDPFTLLSNILKVHNDSMFAEKLSENSKRIANTRHNKLSIFNTTINMYKRILSN